MRFVTSLSVFTLCLFCVKGEGEELMSTIILNSSPNSLFFDYYSFFRIQQKLFGLNGLQLSGDSRQRAIHFPSLPVLLINTNAASSSSLITPPAHLNRSLIAVYVVPAHPRRFLSPSRTSRQPITSAAHSFGVALSKLMTGCNLMLK